jgi:Lon protease-like protein
MFPLGTVLLPGAVLPLHVFEERYRALVADCLAGEGELGVVLIERGSEVGGGEQRLSVGTRARIVEARPFPDGRWAVVAVGVARLRVERWADDAPYPRAEVADWADEVADPTDGDPDGLPGALAATTARLRRVLAAATELGDAAAPATTELAEDPLLASYQVGALAPIGPLDRQAVLEAPGPRQRFALLDRLLDEAAEVLAARLALAEDEDPTGPAG